MSDGVEHRYRLDLSQAANQHDPEPAVLGLRIDPFDPATALQGDFLHKLLRGDYEKVFS